MHSTPEDEIMEKIRSQFTALDKNASGTLDMKELVGLATWVFDEFGRSFKSAEDKKKAVAKQVERFNKLAPAGVCEWNYVVFEAYFRNVLLDAEKFAIKREEAFVKGFDKSAAAQKFRDLDKDGSGWLDGAEIVIFAEWVFTSFRPDGKPMTDEQKQAEAQKLLTRLDAKKGNNDGRFSYTEIDFYIQEKFTQIEQMKQRVAEKAAKLEEKKKRDAARI